MRRYLFFPLRGCWLFPLSFFYISEAGVMPINVNSERRGKDTGNTGTTCNTLTGSDAAPGKQLPVSIIVSYRKAAACQRPAAVPAES